MCTIQITSFIVITHNLNNHQSANNLLNINLKRSPLLLFWYLLPSFQYLHSLGIRNPLKHLLHNCKITRRVHTTYNKNKTLFKILCNIDSGERQAILVKYHIEKTLQDLRNIINLHCDNRIRRSTTIILKPATRPDPEPDLLTSHTKTCLLDINLNVILSFPSRYSKRTFSNRFPQ